MCVFLSLISHFIRNWNNISSLPFIRLSYLLFTALYWFHKYHLLPTWKFHPRFHFFVAILLFIRSSWIYEKYITRPFVSCCSMGAYVQVTGPLGNISREGSRIIECLFSVQSTPPPPPRPSPDSHESILKRPSTTTCVLAALHFPLTFSHST